MLLDIIRLSIIWLFILSTDLGAQSDLRWWQREVPSPSASQQINPRYLEKKRELEMTWDLYQGDLKLYGYFLSTGQSTNELREFIQFREKKINLLEYELSEIPIYITGLSDNREGPIIGNDSRITYTPLPPVETEGDPPQTVLIEVLIKGYDNGIKENRQLDYSQALVQAKLQAIERAGIEIRSITMVENFVVKQDLIESYSKGVLMPGFQIIDLGYQEDDTYLVILSGRVKSDIN